VHAAVGALAELLEREQIVRAPEQCRVEIVRKLLAREPVDPNELDELDYELYASRHLGVVATGPGAGAVLQGLRRAFGCGMLGLAPGGRKAWAWIGGRQSTAVAEIEALSSEVKLDVYVAVGEPGQGLEGWLLTHHQAHAALGVALHRSERFTRYADDRLLAAALQNDTLARSLEQRYLTAFAAQRDGGAALRSTLRAYIDIECNASSAAHALKVDRRAVNRRVRAAETLIGCSLRECLAEVDVALRLQGAERRCGVRPRERLLGA
jgi:hypothetical protein